MDANANSIAGQTAAYAFYPSDDDHAYQRRAQPHYAVPQYVLPNGQVPISNPGHLSLNMTMAHQYPVYYAPSPVLADPSPPPLSPYGTPPPGDLSGGSSGPGSPASSHRALHGSQGATQGTNNIGRSNIHHGGHSVRYNPTAASPSPVHSSSSSRASNRRRRSLNDDYGSDQDDMGVTAGLAHGMAENRKEATRRQRIEAEQKRRDELRDGYSKLREVLPVTNQKNSKVSLLDRATNHITSLNDTVQNLQTRLSTLESEVERLRRVNEQLSVTLSRHPNHADTLNLGGGLGLSLDPDVKRNIIGNPNNTNANGHGNIIVKEKTESPLPTSGVGAMRLEDRVPMHLYDHEELE